MGNLTAVSGPYRPFEKDYAQNAGDTPEVVYAFDLAPPVHAPKADNYFSYSYDPNGNLSKYCSR